MGWNWIAAAAMALSVVGTAAQARVYELTVTLDRQVLYPPDGERYDVPIAPIVFQQRWTLGDFPGTPPVMVDPGCDDPCSAFAADGVTTAQVDGVPAFEAAAAASLGLGPLPVGDAMGIHSVTFIPPDLTSDLVLLLSVDQRAFTPDGFGGTRVRSVSMGAVAIATGPDTPGPFTNHTASFLLTGGGTYRITVQDSGCPDGSCDAFIDDYLGTFTAVALGVPEPGTWALMILGFGAAGARLRLGRRERLAA